MPKFTFIVAIALFIVGLALGTWFVSTSSAQSEDPTWPYPPPSEETNADGTLPEGDLAGSGAQSTISDPYPAPEYAPTTTYVVPMNVTYSNLVYLPIIMKPYDRTAAVSHAEAFAHGRSADYPNFGTGCSCTDCTNYVSQALHKGGIQLKTGNWDDNSIHEWWYRKVLWWYENSKTWSATDWFNTYLFQNADEFEYRSWPTELESGDFFLMDLVPDGIPDHARFIIGEGNSSIDPSDYTCTTNPIPPSSFGLLANQHCVDRQHILWDYNAEGVGVWPFHVIDLPEGN
jgi:hypothetical protein